MKSLLKQVVVGGALVSMGFVSTVVAAPGASITLAPLLNAQAQADLPVLANNGRMLAFKADEKDGQQAIYISHLTQGKFSQPTVRVTTQTPINQSKQRLQKLVDTQAGPSQLTVMGNRVAFMGVDHNNVAGLFYAEPRGKQTRLLGLAMLGQPAPNSKQTFATIAYPNILVNRQQVAVAFEARLNQTDAVGIYLANIVRKGRKTKVDLIPVAVPGQKLDQKTIRQAVLRGYINQGRELAVAVRFNNGASGLYRFKA